MRLASVGILEKCVCLRRKRTHPCPVRGNISALVPPGWSHQFIRSLVSLRQDRSHRIAMDGTMQASCQMRCDVFSPGMRTRWPSPVRPHFICDGCVQQPFTDFSNLHSLQHLRQLPPY